MSDIKPQCRKIRENEVLLKENSDWMYFAAPQQVFSIPSLEEVLPALHEIERLIQVNGWYAAGFISYDAAPAFDPALETRASSVLPDGRGSQHGGLPYLWFGLYPKPRIVRLPKPEGPGEILNWQPTIDRETYDAAVRQIRGYIAAGQTYQVNYTLRLQADFSGSPWDFFLHLVQHQNSHAAYVDTGRFVICSASPELFFQLDRNTITCRPMKGTAARGRTSQEDRERSTWLRNSEKNRAENVMIVDMIRNDLGRIAQTGSVHVSRLFETERYPTLWQMTSTVTAETHASLVEILTALFPCASITGAPKVSTTKIIAELENSPRQVYTGNIGYVAPGRKAKFNVAIRTALIDRKQRRAEYGVGGGIVWDSASKDEYAEALLKAQVLFQGPTDFSLLETMLWTPGEGFFLRERHLARMLDSARYFGIPLEQAELEVYLGSLSSRFQVPQRVRVLLDQDGTLRCESHPFAEQTGRAPLQVHLAERPVDSHEVFLFHKTTRRAVYESAREGFEQFDDILLYNEMGELTEFTIGNLVSEMDGQWFTPPITCGVLPGTFRAHLLESGQVRERTIHLGQLKDCTRIFRVNSLRKWQQVEIP